MYKDEKNENSNIVLVYEVNLIVAKIILFKKQSVDS